MRYYVYENHLGGLYRSGDELSIDDTYCDECGSSDWTVGSFDEDNLREISECLADYLDTKLEIDGVGLSLGYELSSIKKMIFPEGTKFSDIDILEAVSKVQIEKFYDELRQMEENNDDSKRI